MHLQRPSSDSISLFTVEIFEALMFDKKLQIMLAGCISLRYSEFKASTNIVFA